MVEKLHTFCRICEPSCGLVAEVENGQVLSLKPDKSHPVTKGFACHKGIAVKELHEDPDRLNHPLMKQGDDFVQVSWDEALTGVAEKLKAIKDKYGDEALASYTGNPLAFNALAGPAIGSFLMKAGVRKNFSSGTQDCTNKFAGGEAVFGSSTIHPIPDIEHTDFLLIFGSNPRVSHMSFLSIADPVGALREAKKRGCDIRFVDPRQNETVAGIGQQVPVKPDTDVYLMAAILQHLKATGRVDEDYLLAHGDNIDGLWRFVEQYSPDRVAPVVGISADDIKQLAEDFGDAETAAVYMSTGVNMGRQGTLAYWLLYMLSLVTGNLDQRGGNIYSLGFYPAARAGRVRGDNPFFDSPFGELRKIRGSLPGNLLPDMIEAEENPIRGLVVISGNPLLSMGNGARLRQAFEKLEFVVCIDIYANATSAYADYVLPATDMLEREDFNICGLGMQQQPFVQYTNRIVPPVAERRPEWWILGRLEQAMGYDSDLDGLADDEQPGLFDRLNHMLRQSDLDLDQVKAAPANTVTLPPVQPGRFFNDWIQTENQRVDCCPSIFTEALDRCESIFQELVSENSLKMISRRTNYMVNSWLHNLPSLKRGVHLNNPLYMHPEDARARNLGDGATVRVRNDWGDIEAVIALDESLKPGVVALTHGWGHEASVGMKTAQQYPGVNANDLLPSGPGSYEKLSNQAFMTGIPVEVEISETG